MPNSWGWDPEIYSHYATEAFPNLISIKDRNQVLRSLSEKLFKDSNNLFDSQPEKLDKYSAEDIYLQMFIHVIKAFWENIKGNQELESNRLNVQNEIIAHFLYAGSTYYRPGFHKWLMRIENEFNLRIRLFWKSGDTQILRTDDFSAGQLLYLSMILRVAANVERNSIVLIDEPEVCLHPNWQVYFMEAIAELIPIDYMCHTIIATHSPYIAANSDSIVVASDKNANEFSLIRDNVRSLSYDEISFYAFGAKILPSAFVEREMNILLDWLSDENEKFLNEKQRIAYSVGRSLESTGSGAIDQIVDQVRKRIGDL